MNAINIFLAMSGLIVTALGFGVAIIRGAEFMSKEKV
jgi:hypothetical protein